LTRWGSSAVMVKRVLEQKEAIRIVLSGDCSTIVVLAIIWQNFVPLSPLEDLTESLSGESHATISAIKPLLDYLLIHLLALDNNSG